MRGPLVGDIRRDRSDAEPLLHRCESGLVAGHDGHLGALVHQGLDEPEAQASAAAGHHDGLVLEAHRPLPCLVSGVCLTSPSASASSRCPAECLCIPLREL